MNNRMGFVVKWWWVNVAAFLVAHVVYSLAGHGITGHHEDELTVAQYFGHTFGLVLAAPLILLAQRTVVRPYVEVSNRRIVIGTIAYVFAFWLGIALAGPPLDWFLGFTVLGAAAWIGSRGWGVRQVLLTVATVLCFGIGIFSVLLIAGALIDAGLIDPDVETTMVTHTEEWLLISGVTSLIGGFLSAWPLSYLLLRRRLPDL